MYDNLFTVERGRVVREPNVRQVGDKTLVTISVASNPYGDKAKKRYETIFVDATYAGNQGERASQLKVGQVVGFRGKVGLRMYDKKDGTKGVQFEIPYPESLIIFPSAETEGDAPAEKPAPKSEAKGKDPFDF